MITTQSRRLHQLAIHQYLEDTAFGPEDIKVITTAFRAALEALRVADDKCPMAELIAKNIVDVARCGEGDPITLARKSFMSDMSLRTDLTVKTDGQSPAAANRESSMAPGSELALFLRKGRSLQYLT